MDEIIIRFATFDDIVKIMLFIDKYWKKGHILSVNRKLFEWQYINYGKVCFVIGIDKKGEIWGILGYIPYGCSNKKDIALALWKANHCQDRPYLGIELLMYLMEKEQYRHMICPGINMNTTGKIYQKCGMHVGVMQQWYRLCKTGQHQIADIKNDDIPNIEETAGWNLKRFSNMQQFEQMVDYDTLLSKDSTPVKSKEYFQRRYLDHPIYTYYIYGAFDFSEKVELVVVLRLQKYKNSTAVRFVDCIGKISILPMIMREIDCILIECGAEYIDLYETGVSPRLLYEAGWLPVKGSGNIIPNYFSPYERRNVDIYYSSSDANAVIFKGDGDQDRPN